MVEEVGGGMGVTPEMGLPHGSAIYHRRKRYDGDVLAPAAIEYGLQVSSQISCTAGQREKPKNANAVRRVSTGGSRGCREESGQTPYLLDVTTLCPTPRTFDGGTRIPPISQTRSTTYEILY